MGKRKKNRRLQRSADGIDMVDIRRLKNNHADDVGRNFSTVYVIQHRKYPDKVLELRAASFIHACGLVGWRPRQVRLVEERPVEIVQVSGKPVTEEET